jgi:hypothetical protein
MKYKHTIQTFLSLKWEWMDSQSLEMTMHWDLRADWLGVAAGSSAWVTGKHIRKGSIGTLSSSHSQPGGVVIVYLSACPSISRLWKVGFVFGFGPVLGQGAVSVFIEQMLESLCSWVWGYVSLLKHFFLQAQLSILKAGGAIPGSSSGLHRHFGS